MIYSYPFLHPYLSALYFQVQGMLSKAGRRDIEVEVVFPVASKSISTAEQRTSASTLPLELPGSGIRVLPGPASGEGCSLEGGCAACPYMRINTLAALQVRERRWGGVDDDRFVT